MNDLNIVIPMAGLGSRFANAGFSNPKPFIKVLGKPMIKLVLENLMIPNAHFVLIANESHINKFKYVFDELRLNFKISIVSVDQVTEGSACTVLLAKNHINNNVPLIIANSDQLIDIDLSDFFDDAIKSNVDGSIMVFEDLSMNPKWSFVQLNENNSVVNVKEKVPISTYASVGIYHFKNGSDFCNSAEEMISMNDRVNNEFYTCPVYNYMIKNNKNIGIFEIAFSQMHGLGTPEDLLIYEKSKGSEKKTY